MRRRVARHLFLYLPSQVAPALVWVLALPWLTRLLTRAEFGRLALAFAAIGAGRLLFQAFEGAVVRFYSATDEGDQRGWLHTAFWVHTASNLVLVTIVLLAARWLRAEPLVSMTAILFFERNLYGLLTQFLRARQLPAAFSKFVAWEGGAGLLVGGVVAWGFDLGAIGVLAGYFLGAALAIPFLWRQALGPGLPSGGVSRAQLRRMVTFGAPLTLGQVGSWALRRMDRFQIEAVHGVAAVGAYTVPYILAQNSIMLLAGTLKAAALPLAADLWERTGKQESLRLDRSFFRIYLLAATPMAAGLLVVARPLLELIGGPTFADSWRVMPWVSVGGYLLGLAQRFQNTLVLAEHTRVTMSCIVAAALFNFGVNWALLPHFSYEIAAVSTFLAYALLCLLLALGCHRYEVWSFPRRSAVVAGGCSLAMAAVLSMVRAALPTMPPALDLLISVPFGVVVYGLLLHLSGESSWQEWRAVIAAGRQRAFR